MDYFSLVGTALALLITWFVFSFYRKYKDFPPGPYGLPLLGYAPYLGTKPYLTFKELSRKYGSVFSLTVGSTPSVVVTDYEQIKEIFNRQGEAFSGRPNLLTLDVIFRRKDIASAEGPEWKMGKKFTMQVLRDLGVGRSSLESIVMVEVDKLSDHLKTYKDGQPVEMSSVFFCAILNVIWKITANKVFDPSDVSMASFKKAFLDVSTDSNVSVVNVFPFLRHIAPNAIGYNRLIAGVQKIYNYLGEEVDHHERQFMENNLKDVIDIYLDEIKKRKINGEKDKDPFNKEYLYGTLLNLFLGGVGTLETTLLWGMLLMALNPDIQRNVQNELDANVSDDSYLPQSSRAMIPYTEATLLEIQRFASIVPLAMPHCTTKDTTLKGYKIPARTFIFPNVYAVHHDESYWGDPSVFRPERFLSPDGATVIKHDCFLPFGSGPRSCPGEALAKLELFLFFTTLLRRFSFETLPGESKPTLEPIFGVTLQPQPYSLAVKNRI